MPTKSNRHAALACAMLLAALPVAASAQDIRGLEVCTAEKQMERRTGCLQANIELLQQMLAKLTRQSAARFSAMDLELAAARAEIVDLKATLAKMGDELAKLRARPEPEKKK